MVSAVADSHRSTVLVPAPKLARSLAWPYLWKLYGAMLIALILTYCVTLFAVVIGMIKLIWPHLLAFYEGDVRIAGLLVVAVGMIFLVHVVHHIWQTVLGLVTRDFDHEAEASLGILLDRDKHRNIYELIEEVGKRVGAPTPINISVSTQAECYSIELRRFGVRDNRQFHLVLGLPHLEVFSLDELRVIVAHELAHFSAGHTRFGVFAFRFLESLRRTQQGLENRWLRFFDPLYWYAFSCLWGFLFLTIPIRKYQEDCADRLSAAVYGGELAVRTLLKDWLLMEQFGQFADQQLKQRSEASGENLYHDFADRWHELSSAGHDYLEARLCQSDRTSLWDSHPGFNHRIAAMREYPPKAGVKSPLARHVLQGLPGLEAQLQDRLLKSERSEAA